MIEFILWVIVAVAFFAAGVFVADRIGGQVDSDIVAIIVFLLLFCIGFFSPVWIEFPGRDWGRIASVDNEGHVTFHPWGLLAFEWNQRVVRVTREGVSIDLSTLIESDGKLVRLTYGLRGQVSDSVRFVEAGLADDGTLKLPSLGNVLWEYLVEFQGATGDAFIRSEGFLGGWKSGSAATLKALLSTALGGLLESHGIEAWPTEPDIKTLYDPNPELDELPNGQVTKFG